MSDRFAYLDPSAKHDVETLSNTYFWKTEGGHLNEQGWVTEDGEFAPGEPPGYRPDLDVILIDQKVIGILQHMAEADLIHIGDTGVFDYVIDQCNKLKRYDVVTIMRAFYDTQDSHVKYWAKIAKGILTNKDKRERCFCGTLASNWNSHCGKQWNRCSKHATVDYDISLDGVSMVKD